MGEYIFFVLVGAFIFWFFFVPAGPGPLSIRSWGGTTLQKACRDLKGSSTEDGKQGFGTIDGITWSVKIEKNVSFVIEVDLQLPFDSSFNLTREGLMSRLAKDLGKEDLLTGHDVFDQKMLIRSESTLNALALLDKKLRSRLLTLAKFSDSLNLSNRGLKIVIDDMSISPYTLIRQIKRGVNICEHIEKKHDVQTMIIDNFLHDPVDAVRLKNLKVAALNYQSTERMLHDYEKTLKDSSLDVQIEGASLLGKKGAEHVAGVLRKKMTKMTTEELLKAVELFDAAGYVAAVPVLKNLFEKTSELAVKTAVLRAFTTLGDETLSPFLERKLQVKESHIVAAAAAALGTCGTASVLEKLYRVSEHEKGKTRQEILAAMARIQERLGIDGGWLSASETGEKDGALSVTEAGAEGALSMTERKKRKK